MSALAEGFLLESARTSYRERAYVREVITKVDGGLMALFDEHNMNVSEALAAASAIAVGLIAMVNDAARDDQIGVSAEGMGRAFVELVEQGYANVLANAHLSADQEGGAK